MQLAMKTFAVDEKSVSGYIVRINSLFFFARAALNRSLSTTNFWDMN